MICPQEIIYYVKEGDTLSQLAKKYDTTVFSILTRNPGFVPTDLVPGYSLIICPGEQTLPPEQQHLPIPDLDPLKQCVLVNEMRTVWIEHAYWMHLMLVSISGNLKDQIAVSTRLLQNPDDFGHVMRQYYSADLTERLVRLQATHLKIEISIIHASHASNTAEVQRLCVAW